MNSAGETVVTRILHSQAVKSRQPSKCFLILFPSGMDYDQPTLTLACVLILSRSDRYPAGLALVGKKNTTTHLIFGGFYTMMYRGAANGHAID